MYIYSGQCRLGLVGEPTEIKDDNGTELFIGDIVIISSDGYLVNGLTAIVNDDWQSFHGGEHVKKTKPTEAFIMGIRNAQLKDWYIFKVKDHKDVIDGEHWKDFGFRYSES